MRKNTFLLTFTRAVVVVKVYKRLELIFLVVFSIIRRDGSIQMDVAILYPFIKYTCNSLGFPLHMSRWQDKVPFGVFCNCLAHFIDVDGENVGVTDIHVRGRKLYKEVTVVTMINMEEKRKEARFLVRLEGMACTSLLTCNFLGSLKEWRFIALLQEDKNKFSHPFGPIKPIVQALSYEWNQLVAFLEDMIVHSKPMSHCKHISRLLMMNLESEQTGLKMHV